MEVSEALRCVEDGESGIIGITLAAEVERLKKENSWLCSAIGDNASSFENGRKEAEGEWLALEKQYAESLGRMAQLCNVVCPFVMDQEKNFRPIEVLEAASEIMEYVEAVKP